MKKFKGVRFAAPWHEWLGLICAFTWFFSSMINYYEPFFTGTWTMLIFMLLLCAGLAVAAFFFAKRPGSMNLIVRAATIAGAVCTALIPFLPEYADAAVFWLSALFMTPLLCRRLYGVLVTARENTRIRMVISAVAATIVIQMIWALLPLPFIIKFPVLSVFALLGLPGASAQLPAHQRSVLPKPVGVGSPVRIARIVAVFALLVLLNIFNTVIHTQVMTGSLEDSDLFSLLTWGVVPVSFLFFAFLTDLKRERLGFAVGLAMILIGCFTALMPSGDIWIAPLLLTGEFGGTVTEFCFLTMPLLLFPFSKRPMLTAVSGLIAHTLLSSAVSWTQDIWMPDALLGAQIGRPMIIFGAVCAVLLVPLAFSAWNRHRDATLIAALLDIRKHQETAAEAEDAEPCNAGIWTQPLDLLEIEHRIALLLCEGRTRTEISEQLEIPSAEVSAHMRRISGKIGGLIPVGRSPYALKAALCYGLTRREAEVFCELLKGRSNAEISANLYIEDSTVKTHVNRIMRKTRMSNRAELIAQVRGERGTPPFTGM